MTGVIGYDVRHLRGLFQGGRWVEAPIWWQILVGLGLLLLAWFFIRRLPARWMMAIASRRIMMNVGSGKSRGAGRTPGATRAIEAGDARPAPGDPPP